MKKSSHRLSVIKTCLSEHVLLVKGRGTWNESAANQHSVAIKQHAAELVNTPWICVADGTEWDAGIPDIEPILTDMFQWMRDNGCTKQIIMINQPVSKDQIERANETAGESLPTIFVNTIEQARDVARQSGYADITELFSRFVAAPYTE